MAHDHHHNERTFTPDKAHRLLDPERLKFLPPEQVVAAMDLRDGMTVGDIGAGSGFFAIPIARAIPHGRVLAVDFQEGMLDVLREQLRVHGAANVTPVAGEARTTTLGDGACDRLLLANVWHELDDRHEVLRELRRILRPDGLLAIVDWRPDCEPPPGPPPEHRVGARDVQGELERDGWMFAGEREIGSYSYAVVALPRPAQHD